VNLDAVTLPELVGEPATDGAVDLERLGLPSCAVQSEHQLSHQPLA